jgi:hypothetical protein
MDFSFKSFFNYVTHPEWLEATLYEMAVLGRIRDDNTIHMDNVEDSFLSQTQFHSDSKALSWMYLSAMKPDTPEIVPEVKIGRKIYSSLRTYKNELRRKLNQIGTLTVPYIQDVNKFSPEESLAFDKITDKGWKDFIKKRKFNPRYHTSRLPEEEQKRVKSITSDEGKDIISQNYEQFKREAMREVGRRLSIPREPSENIADAVLARLAMLSGVRITQSEVDEYRQAEREYSKEPQEVRAGDLAIKFRRFRMQVASIVIKDMLEKFTRSKKFGITGAVKDEPSMIDIYGKYTTNVPRSAEKLSQAKVAQTKQVFSRSDVDVQNFLRDTTIRELMSDASVMSKFAPTIQKAIVSSEIRDVNPDDPLELISDYIDDDTLEDMYRTFYKMIMTAGKPDA